MSSVKTGNHLHKKLHPVTVLIGENGLPVDTIATLSGTYEVLAGVGTLTYNTGVVTTIANLTVMTTIKPRYTGKYALFTKDGAMWYIDKNSINVALGQFNIYSDDDNLAYPTSIDLSAGWKIAELDIVNRLATTSMAKIDQIEFRDLEFQFSIDGDKVKVAGENGNTIEPNEDGSLNVVGEITLDTAVATPSILNVSLTTANTDYQVVLPAAVKRYSLKVRDGGSQLKVAFTPINTNPYITVSRGTAYLEEGIKRDTPLTIYVQSSKDSQILEVVYWT